jgi:hypothetical protein
MYDVYVQYNHYSRATAPPTQVTVTLELENQPQIVVQRDMVTCGHIWYVGRTHFETATPFFQLADSETSNYQSQAGERCR